jgi:hypothetical protein
VCYFDGGWRKLRRFIICTVHQILSDQIKEDKMRMAWSVHGGDEKYIQSFNHKVRSEERS